MTLPKHPDFLYGTAWKEDRTAELSKAALTAGFTGIDTANQRKHYHEVQVGETLKQAWDAGTPREDIFIQSKFTSLDGQDNRLPYDPNASITDQVKQSFASSLEHLHVEYLDSYLLHGPYNHPGLGDEDWEVWKAIENIHTDGKAKFIGISNVNIGQLEELWEHSSTKPMAVQNRCYANTGWDQEVRAFCKDKNMMYQGFSLLTANPQVVNHPKLGEIGARAGLNKEQVIFCFARQIGMVPVTGTTNSGRMRTNLKALDQVLTGEEMELIETFGV